MLVFPSLLFHTTLDHVLHPALALISEAPSVLSKMQPYSALKKPFPCDMYLVNCRTVFKSQPTVTEAALVLHRRGFDCGFKHFAECELTNGQVCKSDVSYYYNSWKCLDGIKFDPKHSIITIITVMYVLL